MQDILTDTLKGKMETAHLHKDMYNHQSQRNHIEANVEEFDHTAQKKQKPIKPKQTGYSRNHETTGFYTPQNKGSRSGFNETAQTHVTTSARPAGSARPPVKTDRGKQWSETPRNHRHQAEVEYYKQEKSGEATPYKPRPFTDLVKLQRPEKTRSGKM